MADSTARLCFCHCGSFGNAHTDGAGEPFVFCSGFFLSFFFVFFFFFSFFFFFFSFLFFSFSFFLFFFFFFFMLSIFLRSFYSFSDAAWVLLLQRPFLSAVFPPPSSHLPPRPQPLAACAVSNVAAERVTVRHASVNRSSNAFWASAAGRPTASLFH